MPEQTFERNFPAPPLRAKSWEIRFLSWETLFPVLLGGTFLASHGSVFGVQEQNPLKPRHYLLHRPAVLQPMSGGLGCGMRIAEPLCIDAFHSF
jgi:hypothetical protein